jgi:hypothetical protein
MINRTGVHQTGSNRNMANHKDKRRAILSQVDTLAWLLDNSIPLPIINYRIGVDALIGLVPGLGDIAGLLLSSYIVMQAMRLGVPRATLLRMLANIGIEALVGIVPIVGDIFDATFKANARNVHLLQSAVQDVQLGRKTRRNADRGFILLMVGGLLALIALIGAAGVAIFSWILSLFR